MVSEPRLRYGSSHRPANHWNWAMELRQSWSNFKEETNHRLVPLACSIMCNAFLLLSSMMDARLLDEPPAHRNLGQHQFQLDFSSHVQHCHAFSTFIMKNLLTFPFQIPSFSGHRDTHTPTRNKKILNTKNTKALFRIQVFKQQSIRL